MADKVERWEDWSACNDGKCSCKQIWAPDYPIATVEAGKWGDDYCSIRLVGETSLDLKAEAYMEQITYGEISEKLAVKNIRLIVAAVNACGHISPSNPMAVAEGLEDIIKGCNTFGAAMEIWRLDPSKSPVTLITIFNETIGKSLAAITKPAKKGD